MSDNCGGQNKNINMILMYLREIHSGCFTEIDHYSYMACNRAFGSIEKSVRATGDIYDFRGYCAAIKESVVERQTVNVMRRQDFFSLDVLQKEITLRRPQAPYGFQDARCFSLKSQFRSGYYVSMGCEGPLGSVRLQKGTTTKNPASFNLTRVIVPQKYDAPRRLKLGKV